MSRARSKPTAAQARAARENGKQGGRPKSRLPQEIIDRIGPAPVGKPLELNRWCGSLLAVCLELQLRGEIDRTLGASIRAYALAIVKSIPPDVFAAVEQALRNSLDDQEADDLGPRMEVRSDVTSYRGTPR